MDRVDHRAAMGLPGLTRAGGKPSTPKPTPPARPKPNGMPVLEEMVRLSGDLAAKNNRIPGQAKLAELENRITALERGLLGIDASIEGRAVVAVINHMVRKVG